MELVTRGYRIDVNEEPKAYIDPLTTEEFEALERSLLAEGCRVSSDIQN
jgi:hypothetical protein